VSWIFHAVVQDGFLDLVADSVRVGIPRSRNSIKLALCAVDLEVPSDLVELLAGVSDDLAGFADVFQFVCQLQGNV